MNRATIPDTPAVIPEQPGGCFNHHNDETVCNTSTYNGTKCEYFPAGKYSAPRCSPVNNLKKQLGIKLNSGLDLSTDDITHIQQIRDHDKQELKTVRSGLIVKKNTAKEEKNQLRSLLRTLYLERQNHKESLRDLEEKFKILQSQSNTDKVSLDRFYKKQLERYKQEFVNRNAKLEKLATYKGATVDTLRKRNSQDYDTKITTLNETCTRENDRLNRVNISLLLKYNRLKQTLETKTSGMSQDSTNMSNQYKVVKDWLKILDMDEIILKEHIRNFNKSKGEYNRLIASLKLSKLHTDTELKQVSAWLNRPNTITKMDETAVDHAEAILTEPPHVSAVESDTAISRLPDTAISRLPDTAISRLPGHRELDRFKRNTVVKPNTEFKYDTSSEALFTSTLPDSHKAPSTLPTTPISSLQLQHAGSTVTKQAYPDFDELFSATYYSDNDSDK